MTKNLLILGDLIIDKTFYVNASRLSPEGPCPVGDLINWDPITTPGGAGLAASYAQKKNIPYLFGTGMLFHSNFLSNTNTLKCINLQPVEKIRYIDKETGYHLIRIDTDKLIDKTRKMNLNIYEFLKFKKKESFSCIICLDYNKGFFKEGFFPGEIIEAAKRYNIPVYVDSRHSPQNWIGATTLKVNQKEYSLLRDVIMNNTGVVGNQNFIRKELKLDHLIITKGSEGADIIDQESFYSAIAPKLEGTPDITGCGDVFDISFCYHYYTKRYTIEESLSSAVENATKYAYTGIRTRLCNQVND